jgi:ATP-binding cassette subfamily C protein
VIRIVAAIRGKLDFIAKLSSLFDRVEKLQFLGVMLLPLVVAFLDALGVASILPFISLVINPSVVDENQILNWVFNSLGFTNTQSFLIFVGFMMLGIIVAGNLASAFATWAQARFVWRTNHRVSSDLLKKYLSMPYVFFLNQNSSNLGKNVLSEVMQLTKGLLLPLINLLTGFAVVLVITALLLYVNPQVTLIAAVAIVIPYLLIYFNLRRKLRAGGKKRLEENRGRFKAANEALGGIKDIKILGREGFFLKRFLKHSEKFSNVQAWSGVVGQIPRYITEIIAFGGAVGVILFLLYSGRDVQQVIPLVGFFALAWYRLLPSLQAIFSSFTDLQFNTAVLDKIFDDLNVGESGTGKISFGGKLPQPAPFEKNIKLENISFSYPGEREPVLKDVSLDVGRNTSVALVGPTGCGKTTLVDIVLGLLTPDRGVIKVDGVEITNENIKNWQRNIGYVPQQIYLSDDTVARNIAFGLPDEEIDMAQVRRAAKLANIHDFIEKETSSGYDTVVGERGVRLSGGQKQRIGIARALYNDPEVVVFDEATSSLDTATERAVLEAMERVSKLKTMIIIAHRISTVKNCDLIYLMDKGKIVSQGTHEYLMENNAQFQEMSRDIT